MKTYFLDSSALVKRYVNEHGSELIQEITDTTSTNIIIVASITYVEVLSAFARLQREGKIEQEEIEKVVNIFKYDWEMQYQSVEIDKRVIEVAGQLVLKYPLRAYDSIQLSSAIIVSPFFNAIDSKMFIFVSADNRLLDVASNEGLTIENPNK